MQCDLTMEQIDTCRRCAKRELDRRKKFYPKQVEAGIKTQPQADFELEGMELIHNHFCYMQIHADPEQQKIPGIG